MKIRRIFLAVLIAAVMSSPLTLMGANPVLAGNQNGNRLEGTWVVTVAATAPNFPPSFIALETYSRGGGMVTSNNLPVPVLPKLGQGSWEKDGNQYAVVIQFFTFDENGAPNGSIRVTHTLNLQGKDAYSGVGEAEFRDVNGGTLFTLPFTSEGQRLTEETP